MNELITRYAAMPDGLKLIHLSQSPIFHKLEQLVGRIWTPIGRESFRVYAKCMIVVSAVESARSSVGEFVRGRTTQMSTYGVFA